MKKLIVYSLLVFWVIGVTDTVLDREDFTNKLQKDFGKQSLFVVGKDMSLKSYFLVHQNLLFLARLS